MERRSGINKRMIRRAMVELTEEQPLIATPAPKGAPPELELELELSEERE